jgi:hypothetical protein
MSPDNRQFLQVSSAHDRRKRPTRECMQRFIPPNLNEQSFTFFGGEHF